MTRPAGKRAQQSRTEKITQIFQLSPTAVSALFDGVHPQVVLAHDAPLARIQVDCSSPTMLDCSQRTAVERPQRKAGADRREQGTLAVEARDQGRSCRAAFAPTLPGCRLAAAAAEGPGPMGIDPTLPALGAQPSAAQRSAAAPSPLQRPSRLVGDAGRSMAQAASWPTVPAWESPLTIEPSQRVREDEVSARQLSVSATRPPNQRATGGHILWSALIVLAGAALGTSLLLWSQRVLAG